MPGFLLLSTLLTGVAALLLGRRMRRGVALVLVAGVVVTWIGIAADLWVLTTAGLFAGCVTAGVLVGRVLPTRARPLVAILVSLAALDLMWITSGGGEFEGWLEDLGSLVIQVGRRTSTIGTLDLVIASALATSWVRRGAAGWLAVAPGPIGMALSNIYVAITGETNLPLVPFLLLGWLVTEGVERLRDRSTGPTRSGVVDLPT